MNFRWITLVKPIYDQLFQMHLRDILDQYIVWDFHLMGKFTLVGVKMELYDSGRLQLGKTMDFGNVFNLMKLLRTQTPRQLSPRPSLQHF